MQGKGRKMRITKKKSHSLSDIKSTSPPLIGEKPVPIHFQYRKQTKQIDNQVNKTPKIWGCLVPPEITKLEKTLYKTINTFERPENIIEKKVKKQKSSELILLKYLKRKQRRQFRQPHAQQLLETFYQYESEQSKKNQKLKKYKLKANTTVSPIKKDNFYQTSQETVEILEQDPGILKNKLSKKSEKKANMKIQELNSLIKWRQKILEKLHTGVKHINQNNL